MWSGAARCRGAIGCSTREKLPPVSSPSIMKRTPTAPRLPAFPSFGPTIFGLVLCAVASISLSFSMNSVLAEARQHCIILINGMSTEIKKNRKYELRARAESQERTRQRIAGGAAGLHEGAGPAETTVAEIARRAGVSRLTVYKHFPDNAALYPACSAHYAGEHPLPDFGAALAHEDPM